MYYSPGVKTNKQFVKVEMLISQIYFVVSSVIALRIEITKTIVFSSNE